MSQELTEPNEEPPLTRDEVRAVVAEILSERREMGRVPNALRRLLAWWFVGVASAIVIEGNIRALYFTVGSVLFILVSLVIVPTLGFWRRGGMKVRDRLIVIALAWVFPISLWLADALHAHHGDWSASFGFLGAAVAIVIVPYALFVDYKVTGTVWRSRGGRASPGAH